MSTVYFGNDNKWHQKVIYKGKELDRIITIEEASRIANEEMQLEEKDSAGMRYIAAAAVILMIAIVSVSYLIGKQSGKLIALSEIGHERGC